MVTDLTTTWIKQAVHNLPPTPPLPPVGMNAYDPQPSLLLAARPAGPGGRRPELRIGRAPGSETGVVWCGGIAPGQAKRTRLPTGNEAR